MLSTFQACSIVEGFSDDEHTEDEILEAWQALIDSGAVWQLQGFYSRAAVSLIEQGLCHA